jgi:hypothetical protein
MGLALSHFIFDRPKLENLLRDHQNLGAHTDIIQFKRGNVTTFRWTHPGTCPLGFGINNQCPTCKRLKTRVPKPSSDHSLVLLKCAECKNETTYNLPPPWRWVHSPPTKGDERGAWIALPETHMVAEMTEAGTTNLMDDT